MLEQGELPPFLARFFWDTPLAEIDGKRHKHFVVERLLEYGNAEAIRWLTSSYAKDDIAEVLQSSRRLSDRTQSLWRRHLGLGEFDPWKDSARFLLGSWRH